MGSIILGTYTFSSDIWPMLSKVDPAECKLCNSLAWGCYLEPIDLHVCMKPNGLGHWGHGRPRGAGLHGQVRELLRGQHTHRTPTSVNQPVRTHQKRKFGNSIGEIFAIFVSESVKTIALPVHWASGGKFVILSSSKWHFRLSASETIDSHWYCIIIMHAFFSTIWWCLLE